MTLMSELEAYREKRIGEFEDAFELLRQELVNDLARKYRDNGIPAIFNYTIRRATLEMKIVGADELTEALAVGDIANIQNALAHVLTAFVAVRDAKGTGDHD